MFSSRNIKRPSSKKLAVGLTIASQLHKCEWWNWRNVQGIFFGGGGALQPNAGYGPPVHEVSRSHTHWRTIVGRTPLDKWSARRTDLYLTTHNTQKRFMSPAGFEPKVSTEERPQTYALDRAATGTGTRKWVRPVFVYTFSLKSRAVCSFETWKPPAQSGPYSRNSLIKRYCTSQLGP